MAKTIFPISHTKKINKTKRNGEKGGNAFYKLIKNAVYGKRMENLRNRINVKFVSNEKDYLKWISKPSYISHKIFDNDLVAVRKGKDILKLNKPAYVGMCILDLTKVLTYKFHYDYIKNKYGHKSRLLFTSNDSFMYYIKTKDVYEGFSKDKKMFDFSNYSAKSKYYDNSNKLVFGNMKDEIVHI